MFDPIFLKYHLSPNHPEDPMRIKYIGEELKKNWFRFNFAKG